MAQYQSRSILSETQVKSRLLRRLWIVHGVLLIALMIVVARLLELQVMNANTLKAEATRQQSGSVNLSAQRGDILARNSKTGEFNILATNMTLDMVYVDPLLVDDPAAVAQTLTDTLITDEVYTTCSQGERDCPRELRRYVAPLYSANERTPYLDRSSGAVLQNLYYLDTPPTQSFVPLTYEEIKEQFYTSVIDRIRSDKVEHVPLLYGATKQQISEVNVLQISGIQTDEAQRYISANPELVNQVTIADTASKLSKIIHSDMQSIVQLLTRRHRRYVQIMRRLPTSVSKRLEELLIESRRETASRKQIALEAGRSSLSVTDPLQSIVLRSEPWRYYPDGSIASHVVGFVDTNGEPLYGIERSYHPQLRGHTGRISTVSDERGRDIITTDQAIEDAVDGDSIVLTIDRFVQKGVEEILQNAVDFYQAQSAQAIVMEPYSGRILAMVNAPVFDSNHYANATDRELIYLNEQKQKEVVVEIYDPDTNQFVVKDFAEHFFTSTGFTLVQNEQLQHQLSEIDRLYDLKSIARYYLYTGLTDRFEIFPTDDPNVWLKYVNNIGVGAYKNRTVQEIYEPGSVMKAITVAIALDEGEIVPSSMYNDDGPVEVDEYEIKNAFELHYGEVTMTQCLEQSINTCLTHISSLLGRRLFHRMLTKFGFSIVTGIELSDEQPGSILSWRKWSDTHLATFAYGQGVSTTALQMTRAFGALANGGKLMKPYIVDRVIKSNGTFIETKPEVLDQVITTDTAETITAMLVSTVNNGPAKAAKVPGYRIAGKTGTSQIPGPSGKYETGTGSTITSFAGYAPIQKPRFVALVKIDRPKTEEFGSKSAAPVFKQIADFLFDYYGIPPDER